MDSLTRRIDSWENLRRWLGSLSADEKAEFRNGLLQRVEDFDDVEAEVLLTTWELWARPGQLAPPGEWTYWAIIAGRGYGKTRSGGEWVRESVASGRFGLVNLIGATADDARDIMIEGESGLLAICGRSERPTYRPSKRCLDWPNGCRSLIFTADEPERLRGKQHQRLWADELAAWRYQEAWDQAMLGLRLGPDPRAVVTTTPKPRLIVKQLLERERLVVTKGSTYENRENLAASFFEEIIRKYEGTRLGRQELLAEVLLDEGLAYRLVDGVHVVPRPVVGLPDRWLRWEAMDHGSRAATAWLLLAQDYAGSTIVCDTYYESGLPDVHAAEVFRRRADWWEARGEDGRRVGHQVLGDPQSIREKLLGTRNQWGEPMVLQDLYEQLGITIRPGNNRRVTGYLRIALLLREDEGRAFPDWHPRYGELGAPRLFVWDTPNNRVLVEQLREAPLEDDESPLSRFPGEAVDGEWESRLGHAHAALRYGVTRFEAERVSVRAEPELDPRAELLRRYEQGHRRRGDLVY